MRKLNAFSILLLLFALSMVTQPLFAKDRERQEGRCHGCGQTHKKATTNEHHRQKKNNTSAQPKAGDCAAEVADVADGYKKASETGIECTRYVFGIEKAGTPSTDAQYRSGGAAVTSSLAGGSVTIGTSDNIYNADTIADTAPSTVQTLIHSVSSSGNTMTTTSLYDKGLSCASVDFKATVIGVPITEILDPASSGTTLVKDCTSYPTILAALTAMGLSVAEANVGKINYACVNGKYTITGNSCSRIATSACSMTLTGGSASSINPTLIPGDYYSIAWGPQIQNSTNLPLIKKAGLQAFNGATSTSFGGINITTASTFRGAECANIADYFCHSDGGLSCSFSSSNSGVSFTSTGTGCADFCGSGIAAVPSWDSSLNAAFPSCPGSSPCGSFMHYLAAGSTDPSELVYPTQAILKVAYNSCGGSMEAGDTCTMKLYGGRQPYACPLTAPGVNDPQFSCAVSGDTATFTLNSTLTSGTFIPGSFVDADARKISIPPITVFGFDFSILASMDLGQIYTSSLTGLSASPTFVSCIPSSNVKCYYDAAAKKVSVVPIGPAAAGSAFVKLCFNAHTCVTQNTTTSNAAFALSQLPSSLSVGPDYTFPIDRPVVGSVPSLVAADFPTFPSFSCTLSNGYACTVDASGTVTIDTGSTSGSFVATICLNGSCKTKNVNLTTGINLAFSNPVYVGTPFTTTVSGITTGGSLGHTATYSIIAQPGGTATDPIYSVDASGNFTVTPQPPLTGTFNYKYCVDTLCQIGSGTSEYNFTITGLSAAANAIRIPGSYNFSTSFTSTPTGLTLGQFTCSTTSGDADCTVNSIGNLTVVPKSTGSFTLQICASTTCRSITRNATTPETFSTFADNSFGKTANYTLGNLPGTLSPGATFSCGKNGGGSGDVYCTMDSSGNIAVTGTVTGSLKVEACFSATPTSNVYCVNSPTRTIYDAFDITPGAANSLWEDMDRQLNLVPNTTYTSTFPSGYSFTDSSSGGITGSFDNLTSSSGKFIIISPNSSGSGTARACMNVSIGGSSYQNCIQLSLNSYSMSSLNFSSSLGSFSVGSSRSRTMDLSNGPMTYAPYTPGYNCTVAAPAKATCSINANTGAFTVTGVASGTTSVQVCYGSHCTPWNSVTINP